MESSACEWIGQFVMERSFMNNRKRLGERTEPCRSPLLQGLGEEQCPPTTAEIERPERKLEVEDERE